MVKIFALYICLCQFENMKQLAKIYTIYTSLFLVMESAFRGLFYFLYVSDGSFLSSDYWKAFILGVRFDLTVMAYIHSFSILFFALYFIFAKKLSSRAYQGLHIYYQLFFVFVFLVNVGDIYFYSYFQDRINTLVFGFFEDDTLALIKTIGKNYPAVGGLILLPFGIIGFRWKRTQRLNHRPTCEDLPKKRLLLPTMLLIFILNGLLARGSFTLFPLGEIDLEVTSNAALNTMAYNSTRAFVQAIELKSKMGQDSFQNTKKFGYEGQLDKAFRDYFKDQQPSSLLNSFEKVKRVTTAKLDKSPHVVLFVLESWGQYWLKYQQPDFDLNGHFASHKQSDFFTSHCLPGTEGTIGTLSSLLIGQTHRYQHSYVSESEYFNLPFQTSPARVYKQAGYETRLVYGGNAGWRGLAKFARAQGYDKVSGDTEIKQVLGSNIEMHPWGIYDDDLYKFVEKTLEQAQVPQFIVVMTTSNHPPFFLPRDYKAPRLQIPSEVLNSLNATQDIAQSRFANFRYSMDAFGDFLTRIKNSHYAEDMIAAATGDHSFWIIRFDDSDKIVKYGVPLYLYIPSKRQTQSMPSQDTFSKTFCSHQDIPVTLYELTLNQSEYFSFGDNLFDPKRDNFAFDGIGNAVSSVISYSVEETARENQILSDQRSTYEKLKVRYQALHSLLESYFEIVKLQPKSK